MFRLTDQMLARRSPLIRYLFYLISGVRAVSFASWKARGEPNPFVQRTYRLRQTERQEFVDIFEDEMGASHGRRRN